MMARSWDDPIYRALLKKSSLATDGAVDHFCTGCHTPTGITSGLITSEVNRVPLAEETVHMPGVDCESCHRISSITGLENGAYVLDTSNNRVKYGPRSDAVSPYHETEYSELHSQSEFCAACHNVSHPFNETPIERTYDEWYESAYRREGVSCQDCHMAGVPGKAAIMGPERPDRASHTFAAANTTVMNHFGDTENVERARQMLRSAAKLELIEVPEFVRDGSTVNLQVKVTNSGAGHKLPTGFPEGREIWLDVKVTDTSGKEIYRLGKIRDGKTEPGTKNYKVHLGDSSGKEVDIEVWAVDRILSDNRILPKGYALESFPIAIPRATSGELTVSVKLNYWPFSQALVDYLLGPDEVEVQVETIAELEHKFTISE